MIAPAGAAARYRYQYDACLFEPLHRRERHGIQAPATGQRIVDVGQHDLDMAQGIAIGVSQSLHRCTPDDKRVGFYHIAVGIFVKIR